MSHQHFILTSNSYINDQARRVVKRCTVMEHAVNKIILKNIHKPTHYKTHTLKIHTYKQIYIRIPTNSQNHTLQNPNIHKNSLRNLHKLYTLKTHIYNQQIKNPHIYTSKHFNIHNTHTEKLQILHIEARTHEKYPNLHTT